MAEEARTATGLREGTDPHLMDVRSRMDPVGRADPRLVEGRSRPDAGERTDLRAGDPRPRTDTRATGPQRPVPGAGEPPGAGPVRVSGRSPKDGDPADEAVERSSRGRAGTGRGQRPKRTGRRRSHARIWIGAALAAVAATAAAVVASFLLTQGSGPAHVVVAPARIGPYVQRPQLAASMDAKRLQQQVIARGAGQASHVVYAVYEDAASVSSGGSPQIILFIGGNLSGVTASGFLTSFTQQFKGAHPTSAGSMGGSAACVSAQAGTGGVALCTWADNDTFGVVASPTMSAAQLAVQMRTIRPGVERRVK